MKPADVAELISLAALWGASFLFMRLGAGEFGPVVLAAVRVVGAALLLMPLLAWHGQVRDLRRHWRPILVVGLTNSALPFLFFGYALLSINAGLSAIFNAASPLFVALIAWVWLKDRLTRPRVLGLAIGFAGVLWLAWDKASFKAGGSGWAVVACIAASACYGFAANFTKRRLSGVPPMAVAAGSRLFAGLILLLPAALLWPAAAPSTSAWAMAAVLAFACTGLAYLLYFRLIANVGPGNAITVTFLVPLFAVLWGWLFLGEMLSMSMMVGCLVILLGTGLTTGLLKWRATPVARTMP